MAGKQLLLAAICSLFLLPAFGLPNGRLRSLAQIKEINKNGPYLGLITVYSAEEDAFFATGAFSNDAIHPHVDLSGRRFRVGRIEGKKVIYVRSGVGMVNAAAATQQLLDLFQVYGVIHFGVSGNTNSSLSIGDVVVPKEFINAGIWDWLKPNGTVQAQSIAKLDVKDYNVPKKGNNSLGRISYGSEEFHSEAGEPNVAEQKMWFQVNANWLQLATSLQGMELDRCVESTICLVTKPKLVVGLRGSTANIFVDNGDYRDFIYQTFGVSSADMESSAVVMTSSSNGYPVIVVRGLSNLAGGQEGENENNLFDDLASTNVAKAVVQFIKLLSKNSYLSKAVGVLEYA